MKNKPFNPTIHGPYWMRAHRDWRFWLMIALMLVGIVTYVMTMDLAWRPRYRNMPPVKQMHP
jgi:hypothetical protein